jgi:hypothetical protein
MYLTNEELAKRTQDVLTNMTILTAMGKISLPSPTEKSEFPWMEIWTHILEEFALRRMRLPEKCIDPETLPNPTAPIPAKGYMESRESKSDLSRTLVKYGNKGWLANALATGEWLVSPASYYSDPSLGHARYDSELEFSMSLPMFEQTTKPVEGIENGYYYNLKDVFTLNVRAATDYYLVSLARGLIYRMFDDFRSDACLIIHDEVEFKRRMFSAFMAIKPGGLGECRAVDYIDPCMPKKVADVYFVKHFRYAYQEEVRFVWTPSSPIAKLPRIVINLGPLNDICELLTLHDNTPKGGSPAEPCEVNAQNPEIPPTSTSATVSATPLRGTSANPCSTRATTSSTPTSAPPSKLECR